jgi:hypothetical protein
MLMLFSGRSYYDTNPVACIRVLACAKRVRKLAGKFHRRKHKSVFINSMNSIVFSTVKCLRKTIKFMTRPPNVNFCKENPG